MPEEYKNKLYYGDNLTVMRKYIKDESVDLIYLDPPFNSKASYNVLFREKNGDRPAAQVRAFKDFWEWNQETAWAYQSVVKAGPKKLSDLLQSLYSFLGRNDMMAYLVMMAVRLVELHRILKTTGSIYLHCDTNASHYIKVIMDALFGHENFRNEITWKRFNFHADANRYGRVSDRILFYSKSPSYYFERQITAFSEDYIKTKFSYVDENGRRFCLSDLNPPGGRGPIYEYCGITKAWRFSKEKMLELEEAGRIYKTSRTPRLIRYLDELPGQVVSDIWTDIPSINSQAKERLGYPTQKPEALLGRIIKASSKAGEVVFDPFCGCGTTIAVAEHLNRRWMGIDITHLAIKIIKDRLGSREGTGCYEVIGSPVDLQSAKELAKANRFEFQYWSLGLINANPIGDKKKGADGGVDGYKLFFTRDGKVLKALIQVKSGHVGIKDIREFTHVISKEGAAMGIFITLEEPTGPMVKEAADLGFFENMSTSQWQIPRMQILTTDELLKGRLPIFPVLAPD